MSIRRDSLMPTYKNIRVPKRGGGTRLQRVQVLASGKYKFVKNLKKSGKKKSNPKNYRKKAKRVGKKAVRRVAKGKFFKNMSLVGFAEDLAWGYGGMYIFGADASGLATARLVQGIQGHALNRRGKARLMFAIADLIDLWLMGKFKFSIPKLTATNL